MNQPVEDALGPTAILVVEDLRERRERKRDPLRPSTSAGRDHVDAKPFVDPVGRPAATPGHIKGDIATATRSRVPMEALYLPRGIPGDNQLYSGISALQHAVQVHVAPAIGVGPAGRRPPDVSQLN